MNAVFVFNYKYVFIIFPAAGKKNKKKTEGVFLQTVGDYLITGANAHTWW